MFFTDDEWTLVELFVDQAAATWRLQLAGSPSRFAEGSLTPGLGGIDELVFGDLITGHATGQTSGAGAGAWDDVQVLPWNRLARPVIVSHAADQTVTGPFVLNGTVADDPWDAIVSLEWKWSGSAYAGFTAASNWTLEVPVSGLTAGAYRYLTVRWTDGSGAYATQTMRLCYEPGGGTCT